MKLVLLGTGGYFPNSHRHTACIMLPEIGVVLDAGSGMYRLADYRQTPRLDIFLTHAHLDHIAGLTYLINLVPTEVLRETVVHGLPDKLDAVREHLFAKPIFPVAPSFRLQPLGQPCALPEGGSLTHFPLAHPGGSIGFRLDWPGRSVAYVTDTTASANAAYIEKIRGVDLLLHEAYFADDGNELLEVTGHSALVPVTELAAAAGVKRLVLVHIDPLIKNENPFDLTAARRIFQRTEIGVDCMELTF
jgi:ribonuclease BN (tRNA processing enzyme)